jgi:hypothetical protein
VEGRVVESVPSLTKKLPKKIIDLASLSNIQSPSISQKRATLIIQT